nr:coiled coil domain containing protein 137 [Hymenolepis microstoma]
MSKAAQLRGRKAGNTRMRKAKTDTLKKTERIKPVLITRGLKTRKHKKLKQIGPLWSDYRNGRFDLDPINDDNQKPPSSFIEMMTQIKFVKKKLNPYRYISNEGDTKGCSKKPEKIPRQGKKETLESYALRLDRVVQDELLKVSRAKKDKAPMVDPETFKSNKTKKSLKRLAEKKVMKKAFKADRRRSGYEHLKDEVKFGEVVLSPPSLTTLPKKVGRGTVSFPER